MGVADHFHANLRKHDSSDPPGAADERVRRESWFKQFLSRPEFASLAGTVMVSSCSP